ncbi:hydroxymethylbilane synthase [Selenomonas sp. F0473]|uniref:hydroxymethylbilane synthase n=2 Tax=Selenomonas sp. F0473 TaxID=999423 RepID=UPI00029E5525|nr:hydroxymethylbilane synthase [Selenomonas sp. F0473]EKU71537.1 porphobilinogen deaminase [Selenomonas sp. F0473]
MSSGTITIGTRASKLALWQAEHIAGELRRHHPSLAVVLKKMTTKGDKILDAPLAKIGGKGLFTKELEQAMLAGEIDLAVHSLKDMPTELPAGLVIGAITERLDAGDAFVSNRYGAIEELPAGAAVGTSSLRRRAQILAVRPDLTLRDLRGNVNTRLEKLDAGEFDAVVLAAAGLRRLGLGDRIRSVLPRAMMLPAVGQGALAIECRAGDTEILAAIDFLRDANMTAAAAAERAFLSRVEGGCQIPVGVYAEMGEGNMLHVDAMIASVDGMRVCRSRASGRAEQAAQIGVSLAEELLDAGGREILKEIGIIV